MKRYLLALLLLTLQWMVAGSDYSSASAQQYANESYFECDDDGWTYISPVPCEGVDVCRQKCEFCTQSFPCDEFDGHDCPDKPKKVICEYCQMEFTQEEFKYHDCTHKPSDDDTDTGDTDPPAPPGNNSGNNHGSIVNTGGNNTSTNNGGGKYKGAITVPANEMQSAVEKAVDYTQRIYKDAAACNIGVQHAFKKLFPNKELPYELRGKANDIGSNMRDSQSWMNVTKAQAQDYANHNCFVIGVWNNPRGHGHIVLVQPNMVGETGMYVMDTGPTGVGKKKRSPFNHSFGKDKRNNVKFYVYK